MVEQQTQIPPEPPPVDPATQNLFVETSQAGEPAQSTPPQAEAPDIQGVAAVSPGDEIPSEPEAGKPWQPADLPEHLSPEDAYGAAKYWQSRYDQETSKMKQEFGQYESAKPIVDALLQDQEALAYLTNRWQQGDGQPGQPPQPGVPQQQQATQQAFTEPPEDLYSEEGEKWMRSLASHLSTADQKIAALEHQLQSSRQEQQQATQIESAVQEAMYTLGMPRADAGEFVNLIAKNGLGFYDDWRDAGRAWMSQRRPSAEQVRQQDAVQRAQGRQQSRVPTTAAAAGADVAGGQPAGQNSLFVENQSAAYDPFGPPRG